MKDLKVYLPSLKFFVMVVIVWVVVTFVVKSLPADAAWANKVRQYLGYA